MKKNALERAQEFDIKKILPLYEKYYEKIVGKVGASLIPNSSTAILN